MTNEYMAMRPGAFAFTSSFPQKSAPPLSMEIIAAETPILDHSQQFFTC
jgi:hypothetical protein